ncbi:hypothetical protein, partial [Kitasatospora putterlickiae]
MTAERSPSSFPTQAGPSGPATPYRMTVTTALPHIDALSLADQCLAAWLKQEWREEPPPPEPADPSGAARPAERLRLGERVLLDRDGGPFVGPFVGPLVGPPPGGRYDRRRIA